MRNKNFKRMQCRFNKVVRLVNKEIAEDKILDRFVVRQNHADWEEFLDKSGFRMYVCIRVYDKRLGVYKDFRFAVGNYERKRRLEKYMRYGIYTKISQMIEDEYYIFRMNNKQIQEAYKSIYAPTEKLWKMPLSLYEIRRGE